MNILLTGPTGFVGARVLEDLDKAGHTVTALAHSRQSIADIQRIAPSASIVFGDVSDPFEMRGIVPDGTEAVIYLPGILREEKKKRLTFQRVHVEGVRNLLEEAKRVGATRWIQMSALGVGPGATTRYYGTKWQAEELVRSSSFAATIVRPSYIFDDRPTKRKNFIGELVKIVTPSPIVPVPGDGEYRGQPVSLDDVSQTIVQSLDKPETIGQTYLLGGPERPTYNEVLRAVARALGLKRMLAHIPLGIMTPMAEVLGHFAFFPITGEQLEMLTHGNTIEDASEETRWRQTFALPMKRLEDALSASLRG